MSFPVPTLKEQLNHSPEGQDGGEKGRGKRRERRMRGEDEGSSFERRGGGKWKEGGIGKRKEGGRGGEHGRWLRV